MQLRAIGLPLALFLSVAGVYLANGRSIGAGDSLPARYLPWSVLRQGNVDLDEFPFLYEGDARQHAPLRDVLRSDVFPQQVVRFDTVIRSPTVPGEYTLLLDLVSEHVTWFADRGSPPLAVPVRVRALDSAWLLADLASTAGQPPTVRIGTDRTSYHGADLLQLTVELLNPDRPGAFDGYLAVQAADGRLISYDGHHVPTPSGDPSAPWVRKLPLPAKAIGRFAVPLSALTPGPYRWYVAIADSSTFRVVARATTDFRIVP